MYDLWYCIKLIFFWILFFWWHSNHIDNLSFNFLLSIMVAGSFLKILHFLQSMPNLTMLPKLILCIFPFSLSKMVKLNRTPFSYCHLSDKRSRISRFNVFILLQFKQSNVLRAPFSFCAHHLFTASLMDFHSFLILIFNFWKIFIFNVKSVISWYFFSLLCCIFRFIIKNNIHVLHFGSSGVLCNML